MADVFSRRKRSEIMSRVRGRGNKATELAMVAILRKNHITGWRRHVRIFGNPDFVFPKKRLAMFVDGCFWHSCPKHATKPSTNRKFWTKKLTRNRLRDRAVGKVLKNLRWRVLRVWQHELVKGNRMKLALRINRTLSSLN